MDEGLGDTAYDISSKANHGVIHGASWVDGKFGKALEFEGSSNYLEVTDAVSLRPLSFSFLFWMYIYSGCEKTVVLSKENRTIKVGFWIDSPLTADYRPRLTLFNGVSGVDVVTSSETLVTTKWYHVAFTYNYVSGSANVYINGVNRGNGSFSNFVPSSVPLWVGKVADLYFKGIIDEVRIYNRALSAEEILDIYNGIG